MPKTTVQEIKSRVQILLGGAKTLAEVRVDDFARDAIVVFSGYGLREKAIHLRQGDGLFSYDLSFNLFNDHCKFRLDSDTLEIFTDNIRSKEDVEIVKSVVLKAYDCLGLREKLLTMIDLNMQLLLPSDDERDKFCARLNHGKAEFQSGGVIAYRLSKEFNSETRFLVDRSIYFRSGIFATWEGSFRGVLTKERLDHVDKEVEICLQQFDLSY